MQIFATSPQTKNLPSSQDLEKNGSMQFFEKKKRGNIPTTMENIAKLIMTLLNYQFSFFLLICVCNYWGMSGKAFTVINNQLEGQTIVLIAIKKI